MRDNPITWLLYWATQSLLTCCVSVLRDFSIMKFSPDLPMLRNSLRKKIGYMTQIIPAHNFPADSRELLIPERERERERESTEHALVMEMNANRSSL
ncbi:hypothetical protein J6590_094302 [Homalodisca vitripennis]|nr:hypothetical protein J6590_097339 [Homalodisca vitripennis]KAG8329122.1 hypothetical protein J6590_094302 [Homalodisca vitripennis]